ncbi:LysR family transcriptional regulator [Periweissella beninensis]|uniref:LysR family transcriptional regulator n=1 Tax=Periweissella beninensis TaxID=504936 RepID=UPI0021A35DF7|nr:LysR family transcriptional regulator [Periweissella beninensis]MCT4395559.1 LysR family transcriptional regulator [Periweissella beninensis]
MLKLLKTFVTVYETRSFSTAAKQLFVSQPTVSNHIHQLELEFNTKLFIRDGNSLIMPTEIAGQLYQKALNLLNDWTAINDDIASFKDPKISLKIAVSHTAGAIILPIIIPLVLNSKDHFDVQIEMHNSEYIRDALHNHQFDIGLIEKPIVTTNLAIHHLIDDELVLAGNLASNLWLIREHGSGVYHYTMQYFKANKISPSNKMIVANNDLIINFLKHGIGKSIVSIHALPKTVLYQVLDDTFNRSFYMLTQQTINTPAIKSLVATILLTLNN